MQIVPFPAYYQSVYTNFDFTSFSLISWTSKDALLQCKRASFTRVFVTICISDSYKAKNNRKSVVFRFGVDKKCKDFIK